MTQAASSPQYNVSSSDLLIRRLRTQDIADIMPIESVSFGRHHWSPDSFQCELKNQIGCYYALVYRPENRVIGYCGYWLIVDEAHITTIAVDGAFRGNGLGELLLVKMLDRMMSQSIKFATLEVRARNVSAQSLYYKYYFKSMGTRPRYYQDTNEDALIMSTDNINAKAFREVFQKNKRDLLTRLGGSLPEGVS